MAAYPSEETISGAVAPDSRIATAMTATRQVIIRVRSPASAVISAGMALKGTWKNAYAVAQARKAITTHVAASAGGAVGPAKISANVTASAIPARSRNGRRRPCGEVLRSLIRPAI